MLLRSFLYVPGSRVDFMAKATRVPADVIQLDLEDSVSEKETARGLVRDFVRDWDSAAAKQLLAVKINTITAKTEYSVPFGLDDLSTVFATNLDIVLVPKVESAEEVLAVDSELVRLEAEVGKERGTTRVIPMIESASGLVHIHEIAQSCDRVLTLAYTGETDFMAPLLVAPNPTPEDADTVELAYGRQQTAVACAAAGLAKPIDTVVFDLENLDFLKSSATVARRLGFGGKFCINPRQVAVVNEVFSPSEEEIDVARRIVDALDAAAREGQGAAALDRRLVDAPMGYLARTLVLERAAAVSEWARLWQEKGDGEAATV